MSAFDHFSEEEIEKIMKHADLEEIMRVAAKSGKLAEETIKRFDEVMGEWMWFVPFMCSLLVGYSESHELIPGRVLESMVMTLARDPELGINVELVRREEEA